MLLTAGVAQQQANNNSAWIPTNLTGLIQWQHYQDVTGLWQDSGRTTALTSSGQTCGYADNRGGSSSSGMYQSTAAAEPAWINGGGGEGYLDANSGDYLYTDAVVCPDTNDLLIGLAFRLRNIGADGIWSWGSTATSSSPFMLFTLTGSSPNWKVHLFIDGNYRQDTPWVVDQYTTAVVMVTGGTGNRLVDVWFDGVKGTQYNGGTALTYEGSTWRQWYTGYSSTGHQHDYYGFVHGEAAAGTYSDTDAVNLSNYLATLGS
jgi:hypothetical protein